MITSTDLGIVIHLTKMPTSVRSKVLASSHLKVNYLLLGLNTRTNSIVINHLYYEPSFAAPEKIIHLNYKAWLSYQLIKHLPSSNAMEYLISLGEYDEYRNSMFTT